jgi:hypothetical protein
MLHSTHAHLSPEWLRKEVLIYEDLSKLGKEKCRFGEDSREPCLRIRHNLLAHSAAGRIHYIPSYGTRRGENR